jgi:hypothetical protein
MKRFVLTLTIAALALAACGSTGSSSPSSSSAQAAPSSGGGGAASPAASGDTTTSQTDTAWGRIWDTLPPSFPSIPGARPSEEAATGAASANLVIEGNVARLVAAALVTQLATAGFPTSGVGTPLEDGSYTLEATGSAPGCKVQLTIKPMGGETFVTILYGAACPHE